MPSVSFDQAASYYDATRGYPDDVALKIARALDQAAQGTPQTAYLEVGVGTGRIALPVLSLGRTYTGVDISAKMLAQLEAKVLATGWQQLTTIEALWGSMPDEQKAPTSLSVSRFINTPVQPASSLRLVVSDIEQLPFADHSFDAVVAVHVFHLVGDWQRAAQEVMRVLRPGGKLLQCWDDYVPAAPTEVINATWRRIVQELGGNPRGPGTSTRAVKQWFEEHGYQTVDQPSLSWSQPIVPREALDFIVQRYWSSTWHIPDDLFAASVDRLQTWARDYFGPDLNVPQMQERHFMISITQ